MFFDTHAHVNFEAFSKDAEDVIQRALDGYVQMILVGTCRKTSQRALYLANKYQKGVYAAVGLHPSHIGSGLKEGDDYSFNSQDEDFSRDVYEQLAKFQKVIAIGEIGLDYYHLDEKQDIFLIKEKQKKAFLEQLLIARLKKLPVIIHCREAHEDLLQLINNFRRENRTLFPQDTPWGVIHCFSGDEDLAWQYFSLGLLVSFNGLITFNHSWDDLIRRLPADKFLIETDCPFLTPVPFRGKRNEPILVKHVAARIAEIRSLNLERIAQITTENAKRLFLK